MAPRNIFEEIDEKQHDEDWNPPDPPRCTVPPGSKEKLAVIAARIEAGFGAFSDDDPQSYGDSDSGEVPLIRYAKPQSHGRAAEAAYSTTHFNGTAIFG